MLSHWFVFRKFKNFTSDNEIRMPPTVPINHYFGSRNQRKIEPKSYSIIPCLRFQARAYFEHSNFFKVNAAYPTHTQLRAREVCAKKAGDNSCMPRGTPSASSPKSNHELFNCNNFTIRYWSWNYRGCWHQICPPIGPR